MLEMGFQEAVDEILGSVYQKEQLPQTLLFSATMPRWVQATSKKYLRPDKVLFFFFFLFSKPLSCLLPALFFSTPFFSFFFCTHALQNLIFCLGHRRSHRN
jgi:hypothetical protein